MSDERPGRKAVPGGPAGNGAPGSIDDEAEKLLRSIEFETGSLYAVHADGEAEELDPAEIHADELDGVAAAQADLERAGAVDEPDGELDLGVDIEETELPSADEVQRQIERAERRRRRLRGVLAACIVALFVAIGIVGVFVWRGGSTTDTGQPDTEELVVSASSSGATGVSTALDSGTVPELASVFGMTPKRAEEKLDLRLQLQGKAQRARDGRISSMRTLRDATVLDADGNAVASAGLGCDGKGKVVYAYAVYGLDALGSGNTPFDELAQDKTIPVSMLRALGVSNTVVRDAEVDDDAQRATWSGKTGRESAPTRWEISLSGGDTASLIAELW